jgi:transposase
MGDSTMTLKISIAVGIDICKQFLDVHHSHTRARARFDNDLQGIAGLLDWLAAQGSADVVALEATGGYEALCWQTLEASGLAVTRLNPKRVRDYAKAAGILAKTDRLDAEVLAHYALAVPVRITAPKAMPLRELEAWLTRRAQLIEMRVAETNRRLLAPKAVQKRIDVHRRALNREIEDIDTRLATALQDNDAWRKKLAPLDGLKGIGPNTRAWLIATLPELGNLGRREMAALPREPAHPRRPRTCAHRALPRHALGGTPRSAPQGLLPGFVGARQTKKSRARGLDAKTPDHHQRRVPLRAALPRALGGSGLRHSCC